MKKLSILCVALLAVLAIAGASFANVNPFMDVPMGHWAYDAMGQLAARGVISGYPDGTYKGNQPTTRYEMSSALARALAVIDMTKASKQDVEMIKKLVVEFKDELDTLGVKVSALDSRVAVLEENLGGWKLWGEFRMDYRSSDREGGLYNRNGRSDMDINRFRIWMQKRVNDYVTVTARLGKDTQPAWGGGDVDGVVFDLFWADIKFPTTGIDMKAGKWQVDWSAADNMYADNDSWFSDRILKGFYFNKEFASGSISAYVTRDDSNDITEHMEYGLRGKMHFNEQFWGSANYMKQHSDGAFNYDGDQSVLWGTLGFEMNPNVGLRGSYYKQDLGRDILSINGSAESSPNAWQLALDVKQDVLKFTSLWVEYAHFDENFRAWTDGPWDAFGATVTGTELGRYDNVLFIKAEQKWSDKWTTFARYLQGNARYNLLNGVDTDNTKNWSLGARYFYTPGVSFELAYDKIENSGSYKDNDDHLLRFRTHISF